jgi:hypothetical protein
MFGYELTDKATKTLRTLSVVLYLVSLVLPTGAGLGLLCLLMGWFEIASSPLEGVAWLANPLLFFAWGSMAARLGNAARALSVVALVFGGSWILHHKAITNEGGIPCGFRAMPATDSGACRASVPGHVGPPFRSMPA